jgi:hypothetical protein
MSKSEDDLKVISEEAYATYLELIDGLPSGSNSWWGYDAQLVSDIAEAFISWKKRRKEEENENSA